MLIDKKFIFINIPRCATTSFKLTCEKKNISTENAYIDYLQKTNKVLNLSETKSLHLHEPLSVLYDKFGYDYPVVAIQRNKHERLYSFWKEIISTYEQIIRYTPNKEFQLTLFKLRNLKSEEIFFFDENSYSLINTDDVSKIIDEFTKRNEIINDINIRNYMKIFYLHPKFYHLDDPRIIWFDFNNLKNFELWVSKILGTQFQLENVNTSKHAKCELKLDDSLIYHYNRIYSKYDQTKKMNTIF